MSIEYIQYVFTSVAMGHRHFNWGLWGSLCWALSKCILESLGRL